MLFQKNHNMSVISKARRIGSSSILTNTAGLSKNRSRMAVAGLVLISLVGVSGMKNLRPKDLPEIMRHRHGRLAGLSQRRRLAGLSQRRRLAGGWLTGFYTADTEDGKSNQSKNEESDERDASQVLQDDIQDVMREINNNKVKISSTNTQLSSLKEQRSTMLNKINAEKRQEEEEAKKKRQEWKKQEEQAKKLDENAEKLKHELLSAEKALKNLKEKLDLKKAYLAEIEKIRTMFGNLNTTLEKVEECTKEYKRVQKSTKEYTEASLPNFLNKLSAQYYSKAIFMIAEINNTADVSYLKSKITLKDLELVNTDKVITYVRVIIPKLNICILSDEEKCELIKETGYVPMKDRLLKIFMKRVENVINHQKNQDDSSRCREIFKHEIEKKLDLERGIIHTLVNLPDINKETAENFVKLFDPDAINVPFPDKPTRWNHALGEFHTKKLDDKISRVIFQDWWVEHWEQKDGKAFYKNMKEVNRNSTVELSIPESLKKAEVDEFYNDLRRYPELTTYITQDKMWNWCRDYWNTDYTAFYKSLKKRKSWNRNAKLIIPESLKNYQLAQ